VAKELPEKAMKNLTENQLTGFGLSIAILFGAWLRLTPAQMAGFPINDGGMFYSMIADLGKHGYALPAFTTYNGGNIPYAYPPFAFYVARFLTDVFHAPIIQILQWLPAIISILVIPAFYLMANELLKTRSQAALATIIFSFSPRAFSWFIMGGGLTRVFGQLFMLLTLYSANRLFKNASRKNLLLTILFGTLTILSHPEAAIQTAGAAFLLWLVTARNKTAFFNGLKVSIAIVALTSIWWGTVIFQHSLTPLLNAGRTGYPGLFLALLPFYFTDETMMTVISVLGIVGLFAKFSRKEYFLPLWMVAAFFIDGRSAAWVANFSLVLLAAVAVDEIILPGLSFRWGENNQPDRMQKTSHLASQLFIGYILAYLLMGTYLSSLTSANIRLGGDYKTAMLWVKENTPAKSRFILITPGSDYPMRDPVQEWFPALTERISLTTLQGQEWILGPGFSQAIARNRELQACADQQADCIESKTAKTGIAFDYLFLSKKSAYQLGAERANADELIKSLKTASQFGLVYENPSVVVFAVKNNW
jgi:hypothetical protein